MMTVLCQCLRACAVLCAVLRRRAFAICCLALLGFPAHDTKAQAHCWCAAQCTFANGAAYADKPAWPKRPNGNNFNFPFSNAEWSECRNYCSGHVQGLKLQALADERKTCGTVNCTSNYYLGTRPSRVGESRDAQTMCPQPEKSRTEFQYAAKLTCGTIEDRPMPLHIGTYETAINVHHPGTRKVPVRYKVALADYAQDGQITPYVDSTIGADGAQVFHCRYLRKLIANPPPLLDGFFVIESASPLDVTAYYTTGDSEAWVNAIDVESYKARDIPAKGFCKPNVWIDLADATNWIMDDGSVPTAGSMTTAWDADRKWMHPAADLEGDYRYKLDVCSCKGPVSYEGTAKSDNASTATFVTGGVSTAVYAIPAPGNFAKSEAPVSFSGNPAVSGDASFEVVVHNSEGPTGLSVKGALVLSSGHVGPCDR